MLVTGIHLLRLQTREAPRSASFPPAHLQSPHPTSHPHLIHSSSTATSTSNPSRIPPRSLFPYNGLLRIKYISPSPPRHHAALALRSAEVARHRSRTSAKYPHPLHIALHRVAAKTLHLLRQRHCWRQHQRQRRRQRQRWSKTQCKPAKTHRRIARILLCFCILLTSYVHVGLALALQQFRTAAVADRKERYAPARRHQAAARNPNAMVQARGLRYRCLRRLRAPGLRV